MVHSQTGFAKFKRIVRRVTILPTKIMVLGKKNEKNEKIKARIAQLVAYQLGTKEVPGSILRKGENF